MDKFCEPVEGLLAFPSTNVTNEIKTEIKVASTQSQSEALLIFVGFKLEQF
jgi:hypothetical protein